MSPADVNVDARTVPDRLDDEPSDLLAVPKLATVAHLVLVLHEYELGRAPMLRDSRFDRGSRHERSADGDVRTVQDHHHIEVNRIARLAIEAVHFKFLPLNEAQLAPIGAYDRFHKGSPNDYAKPQCSFRRFNGSTRGGP